MIRVVTDSSADLPAQVVERYGIETVPLSIRLGDQVFLDRVELSTTDFWEAMRSGGPLAETSAPSAGQFLEVFDRLASEGADGVVCITLSSLLSATYQAATVAAAQIDALPVRVIDSRNATAAIGLSVVAAARASVEGAGFEEVAAVAERTAGSTTAFAALDTLEFLRRGGRIGASAAFFGSALQIKPMIELREGIVVPAGRVRTRSKALTAIVQRITELAPDLEEVTVIHADVAQDAKSLCDRLDLDCPVSVAEIGPVIGTHTGPGTIGAAYRVRRTG